MPTYRERRANRSDFPFDDSDMAPFLTVAGTVSRTFHTFARDSAPLPFASREILVSGRLSGKARWVCT
ncbi:hypothetical protein GCM10022222_58960 [Amycolatopsis ultiminotia]|uniref:Uncharacterized protein n=1 Tax=Amycolatopsis ultiminotia TaxID=543629 RepID=A0ABP6XI20_9PSEU